MCRKIETTEQIIQKWTVNDYFSPNIKAEVILDTLLTPYVTEILGKRYGGFVGELCFITKEMSVPVQGEKVPENYGNRGKKIDYVLADEKTVYLVELKTTDSSIRDEQAESYLENCHGRKFGQVFGTKLLSIMGSCFGEKVYKDFDKAFTFDEKSWSEKTLKEAFEMIFMKFDKNGNPASPYAEAARELIRNRHWAQSDSNRSRKYLYTAGQILDYLDLDNPDPRRRRTLWDKDLKLIYLTPEGKCPFREIGKYRDFCIGSFSLNTAGKDLREQNPKNEFALLLADIIKDIYKEKNNDSTVCLPGRCGIGCGRICCERNVK